MFTGRQLTLKSAVGLMSKRVAKRRSEHGRTATEETIVPPKEREIVLHELMEAHPKAVVVDAPG